MRIRHLVSTIEQGWSPQCENFPVEAPDEWGVLKVGCVNGGFYRPSENKKLPLELAPMPAYALKRGDLLISRANTRELVGSAAVVQRDFNNLLLVIRGSVELAGQAGTDAAEMAEFLREIDQAAQRAAGLPRQDEGTKSPPQRSPPRRKLLSRRRLPRRRLPRRRLRVACPPCFLRRTR